MPSIDIVHYIQHLSNSSSDGVRLADKLLVISYMPVKVIQKLLRNFNAYFWH